jgi:hypothetical protein
MRVAQLINPLLCAAALICVSKAAAAEENEIFSDLQKNGVTLSDGTKAVLPKVVMEDGLNAAAQAKIMAGLVPAQRLASFRGGNLNDWFELKIQGKPATAEKPSSARNLDLYYVANGTLETVEDKGFIKSTMGGGGDNFHILDDKQLQAAEIQVPADTATKRDRYAHAKLDLFNMANVRATGHGVSTQTKDSVLIAFKLDPQFAKNANFPNQWNGIGKNAAGVKVPGPVQPYDGAGGYVKVTRVADSEKPQVFIEYHLVFDEPFGWFDGKPVLTSKLPTKVEADVRSFRRDIIKWMKANPQPAGAQAQANPQPAGAQPKADDKTKDAESTVKAAAKSAAAK